MILAVIAISIGAALGALLRWVLGLGLDFMFASISLGTLAANLIGGVLIGIASEVFMSHSELLPVWRLFVITGFLGGLTTFSSFALEASALLLHRHYAMAALQMFMHLGGSIALTIAGIALAQQFLGR